MYHTGKKPKLVLFPHRAVSPRAASSPDDFAIYATYRISNGRYFGSLKVVRKTDSRLLFPFEGAPAIGPFSAKEDASMEALKLGNTIVEADIRNPEI